MQFRLPLELPAIEYQVPVGKSYHRVPAAGGAIPARALPAGAGADGRILCICRGSYNRAVHPGRVARGEKSCDVTWGGSEERVDGYEVLTGE